MDEFFRKIESLTLSEWVGILALIVGLLGLFIKIKEVLKNKSVHAEGGSVAFGDDARGNVINITAEPRRKDADADAE